MKMNLNLNKNMWKWVKMKMNFSCNQCGNDRQIESELSQECKASGRQGQTEDFFCPGDDKQEHGHGIFLAVT